MEIGASGKQGLRYGAGCTGFTVEPFSGPALQILYSKVPLGRLCCAEGGHNVLATDAFWERKSRVVLPSSHQVLPILRVAGGIGQTN